MVSVKCVKVKGVMTVVCAGNRVHYSVPCSDLTLMSGKRIQHVTRAQQQLRWAIVATIDMGRKGGGLLSPFRGS